MKRSLGVVLVVVTLAVVGAGSAHAQASGSMQVEAQVVDASASWQSVHSTGDLARAWAADSSTATRILATQLSRIELSPPPGALDRSRSGKRILVTVQYLWN